MMLLLLPLLLTASALPVSEDEVDGDSSGRIIGSSVVTSVSVVMNGQNPEFTDAIGKPVPRPLVPPQVASPINLLNPDKYEFYTFDESGDLIKRLMTMEEIQSIVAGGDGEGSLMMNPTNTTSENDTKVDEIVESVQNVLNKEMEAKKNKTESGHPIFDTPDVSSSWSLILPAIFGNTGNHEIITHKPQSIAMTPESELLEITTKPTKTSTPVRVTEAPTKATEAPTRAPEVTTEKRIPTTTPKDEMKNIPLYHRPANTPSTERIPEASKTTERISEAPKTTERITEAPKTTERITEAPKTTERIPEAPKTTERITEAPKTTERIPETPKTTERIPEAPKTTERIPEAPKTTENIPEAPKTTQKIPEPPKITQTIPEAHKTTESSPEATSTTPKRPTTPPMRVRVTANPNRTRITITRKPTVTVQKITEISKLTPKPTESTKKSPQTTSSMPTNSPATPTSTEKAKTTITPPVKITEELPSTSLAVESSTMTSTENAENSEMATDSEAMEENSINQIIQSLSQYPDEASTLSSDGTTVKHPEDTHEEQMPTTVKVISVSEPVKSDESTAHNADHVGKPSKIFANNQLYVDEADPQVSDITTTPMPDTDDVGEEEEETTENLVSLPQNSGIAELIDRFIAANSNSVAITLTPMMETEPMIPKVEHMVQSQLRSNITMTDFIDQVATVASILEGEEAPEVTEEPATEKLDFMSNLEESLSNLLSQVTDERPHSVPLIEDPNIESKMPNIDAENAVAEEDAQTTESVQEVEVPTTESVQEEESSTPASATDKIQEEVTTESVHEEFPTTANVQEEESSTTENVQEAITTDFTTEESWTEEDEQLPETTTFSSFDPDQTFNELESLAQIKESTESAENEVTDNVKVETSIVKETSSVSFHQEKPKIIPLTEAAPEIITEAPQELITQLPETTEFSNTIEDSPDSGPLTSDILSIIGTVGDMLLDTKIPSVETLSTPVDESTDAIELSTERDEATEIPTETLTNTENDEMLTEFDSSTLSPEEFTQELVQETFWTLDDFTGRPTFNPLNFRKNDVEEPATETPDPASNTVATDSEEEEEDDEEDDITQKTTQRSSGKTTQYKFITIGVNRRDDGTPINVPTPFGFHTPTETASETTTELSETTTDSHEPQEDTTDESEEIYTRLGETTEKSPQTTLIDEENSIAGDAEETPTTNKIPTQKRPISVFHVNTPKPSQISPALKQNPRKPVPVNLKPAPKEALGLEQSTQSLDQDLIDFVNLCNELAFTYWKAMTAEGISTSRTVVVAPFAITSMLAMIFLGARGATSGEMNEILRLDDMVTFNPHAVFRNVTDSIENLRESGVFTSAVVRELFSDRSKGKLLSFYKDKVQQFYSGHVEEVNYAVINDIIRRRTNLLMKRHTWGKVMEFLKTNTITMRPPLATVSANIFKTDCSKASSFDRDGEMFFQITPIVRQRRLVPLPAAVFRSGFLAGYDPELDATAVAFGNSNNIVSTVLVMPGQQGHLQSGDSLDRLEIALLQNGITKNAWRRLLTTLMERPGLELQIPKFTHRSFINATSGLQRMGLNDLFDAEKSDLRGLTASASKDMFFSDMVQINAFATCGEDKSPDQHHVEVYPSPPIQKGFYLGEFTRGLVDELPESVRMKLLMTQEHQRALFDPFYETKYLEMPLSLRPRQARIPEAPRLRFDRPFLFFVRHNPTGMILYMGRFSPRLHP